MLREIEGVAAEPCTRRRWFHDGVEPGAPPAREDWQEAQTH